MNITEPAGRNTGNPTPAEFDQYARDYNKLIENSVSLSGFSPNYFDEHKIREIYEFMRSKGTADRPLRFLNYGCGIGKSEKIIRKYFAHSIIYSVDISAESISIARENNAGLDKVSFRVFDGINIPFTTKFDVILAAGVFHHIPRENHETVATNICRSLNDSGLFFIFEHNPMNPFTRRVVRLCELDRNAVLLGPSYAHGLLAKCGFTNIELRFVIFFPRALRFLLPLEKFMKKVPLGAQYYFIAQKMK